MSTRISVTLGLIVFLVLALHGAAVIFMAFASYRRAGESDYSLWPAVVIGGALLAASGVALLKVKKSLRARETVDSSPRVDTTSEIQPRQVGRNLPLRSVNDPKSRTREFLILFPIVLAIEIFIGIKRGWRLQDIVVLSFVVLMGVIWILLEISRRRR